MIQPNSTNEALVIAGVGLMAVAAVQAALAGATAIYRFVSKRKREKALAAASGASFAPAGASDGTLSVQAVSQNSEVDDKTAAMIMAIVADDLGVPVQNLRFQSIRPLD